MLAHLQGTISQEEQMLYELVWLIIAFALLFVNRTSEKFFWSSLSKKRPVRGLGGPQLCWK